MIYSSITKQMIKIFFPFVFQCPMCKAICKYRSRSVVEYLPSTLPAPERPPTSLKKYDVAILLRKVDNNWTYSGCYTGPSAPRMSTNMWLIVASEDGVKQYTYDEWVPTLESLRPGALFEATISWKNIESQIRRNNKHEQKEFNDRVRQFYLEKYGHKVVNERETEGNSPASESVFKNFFFKRKNDKDDTILGDDLKPFTNLKYSDDDFEDDASRKESWVVIWEPEAGGLIGNQEADSNFAQITLLPGTKYRVRIASKDGPGSFPIEIDTSSSFVQVHRLKKNFENICRWGILTASISMAICIIALVIIQFMKTKSKKIVPTEEVV